MIFPQERVLHLQADDAVIHHRPDDTGYESMQSQWQTANSNVRNNRYRSRFCCSFAARGVHMGR